ncbi:hypothetical protein KVT40_009146 [Elsinoe batatas]|uniref:Uncharacterized protein n=1 Tax=Elsinoe batatas TaxID=2601811 RepID=A0A8K0KVQ4_9PEZI|nr:hypothetical protein KVT40_009146 [Elsinoe batatas]
MRQGARHFTLVPSKLAQLLHRPYILEALAGWQPHHLSFPLLGNLVAKNQTSTSNASMTSHKRSLSEALRETNEVSDTVHGDSAASWSTTSALESVNKRVTLALQTTGHATWHETNHEELLLTASPVALDVPRLFASGRPVPPVGKRGLPGGSIYGPDNANDGPVVHYQHVTGDSTIESNHYMSGPTEYLHHSRPLEPPSTDSSLLRDADEPPWSLRTGCQPVPLQVSFLRPPARPKDSLEVQHGSQEDDGPTLSNRGSTDGVHLRKIRAFSSPPSLRLGSHVSSSGGTQSVSSGTRSYLTSQSGGHTTNETRPTSLADDNESRSEGSSDGMVRSAAKPHHTWPMTGNIVTSQHEEVDGLLAPRAEQLDIMLADVGGFDAIVNAEPSYKDPIKGEKQERKCICKTEYSLELPGYVNESQVNALPDTASSINAMSVQYVEREGLLVTSFPDGTQVGIQTLTGRVIACKGYVDAVWKFRGEESLPFSLCFYVIEGSPSEVIIGYPTLYSTGTLTQHKRRICKRHSKRPLRPFGACIQAEPNTQFPTLRVAIHGKLFDAIADTGASTNTMSLPFVAANQLDLSRTRIRSIRLADGVQEMTEGIVLIPWSRLSELTFDGSEDGFREGTPEPDSVQDLEGGLESPVEHVCEDTELQFDVLKDCLFGIVLSRDVISRLGIQRIHLPSLPNPLDPDSSIAQPLGGTPAPTPTPSIHAIYTQPFNGLWNFFGSGSPETPQSSSSTQGSQESIQRNSIKELKRQESRRMAQYARYVATLDDPVEIAQAKRNNELDLQLFEARLAALCGGD